MCKHNWPIKLILILNVIIQTNLISEAVVVIQASQVCNRLVYLFFNVLL